MPNDTAERPLHEGFSQETLQELDVWSKFTYPVADLDVAIEVARGVRRLADGEPSLQGLWDQLWRPNTAIDFGRRVATALAFGVIRVEDGRVGKTQLGKQILNPAESRAAKVQAFLGVPLYRTLYERYLGAVLPQVEDMELELVREGVADEHKAEVRIAFHRSAMIAGFFAIGAHRLIMPKVSANAAARPIVPAPVRAAVSAGAGAKSAAAAKGQHPMLAALLSALPEQGSEWPLEARRKWLQSAALNFDLVYRDPVEPAGSITIAVER